MSTTVQYVKDYTCEAFRKSFFSTSGNMCSEYLPVPCGPGSMKLERESKKINHISTQQKNSFDIRLEKVSKFYQPTTKAFLSQIKASVPVNKADICIH